jgi:hypothetical protein
MVHCVERMAAGVALPLQLNIFSHQWANMSSRCREWGWRDMGTTKDDQRGGGHSMVDVLTARGIVGIWPERELLLDVEQVESETRTTGMS